MSYISKIKLVLNIFNNSDSGFIENIKTIKKTFLEYRSFKKILKEGELFIDFENQEESLQQLISKMEKSDFLLVEKLLRNDVKSFLKENKLKKKLDFVEPKDFMQIGCGGFFMENPIRTLWTTGKTFFYMPTSIGKDNTFKFEFFSLPSLEVEIGFEESQLLKFKINSTSHKVIEVNIESSKIKNNVSEFYIDTNKLWFPNKIIGKNEVILLGVGVKSISNQSV